MNPSNARTAAILGQNPRFQAFCNAQNADEAAEFVRCYCGVDSRRDLDTNLDARERFHELRRAFAYGAGRE